MLTGPLLDAVAEHYLAGDAGPWDVLHVGPGVAGGPVGAGGPPPAIRLHGIGLPAADWRALLRRRRLDLPSDAYDVVVVDHDTLAADGLPGVVLRDAARVLRADGVLVVLPGAATPPATDGGNGDTSSAGGTTGHNGRPDGWLVGAVVWAGFRVAEVSRARSLAGPVVVARPVARSPRGRLRAVATGASARLREVTTVRALTLPLPEGAAVATTFAASLQDVGSPHDGATTDPPPDQPTTPAPADAGNLPASDPVEPDATEPSPTDAPAPAGDGDGLRRAGELWDAHADRVAGQDPARVQRAEWQAHPRTQEHFVRRSGTGFLPWLGARLPRAPGHPVHAVSIGAGRAPTELALLADGVLDHVSLFDVSAGSLAVAREQAAERDLADRVSAHVGPFDPDRLTRPANVALFVDSLHHIEDLDGVLGHLAALLGDDGVLFAREYVGPARFAFPDDHLRHARSLYGVLDPALRSVHPELPVPDPVEVAAVDPTEAVRSDEILAALDRWFGHVEVCPVGGGLAFPLWFGLDHDALFETAQGDAAVRWVLEHDARLTDTGELPPYFVFVAARRRPPP
jgi:SAM-dependent methyltransferase